MGVGMSNGTRNGGRTWGFMDLASESVLPGQYDGGRRFTPEQRLMVAVVIDAHRMLQKGRAAAAKGKSLGLNAQLNYEEAEAWLARDDDQPFGVASLCFHLTLSVDLVRRKLGTPDGDLPFDPRVVQLHAGSKKGATPGTRYQRGGYRKGWKERNRLHQAQRA